MMKNYDESVELNHSPNWSYIPDHPYRILIFGGSGSSKTNLLLNMGSDSTTYILCILDVTRPSISSLASLATLSHF